MVPAGTETSAIDTGHAQYRSTLAGLLLRRLRERMSSRKSHAAEGRRPSWFVRHELAIRVDPSWLHGEQNDG